MTRFVPHTALAMMIFMLASCAGSTRWQARLDSLVLMSPLEAAERVSSLETESARSEFAQTLAAHYEADPNPRNALTLATVRALPGHALSDDSAARDLLRRIDKTRLGATDRRVAAFLAQELDYRASVEERNASLYRELESTRRSLLRAKEKIEILTRIEQTVGPVVEERR